MIQLFGHNRHGPKIGEGAPPPFVEEGWVPIEHKVPWDEAYFHAKWHLDASSRFATIEMGRKLGRGAESVIMVALRSRCGHYIFALWFLLLSFCMAALWNRAGHYIFALWFLSSSFFYLFFFPRLISAAADWMSTILRHMVWP